MDLIVKTPNLALWGDKEFRCAVGRKGIISAADKREGDGYTPAGRWPLRQGFFRADRMPRPDVALDMNPIQQDDAWCDISEDPHYNEHVKLPYATLNEKLWRDDHRYDIVFMLGYNDAPVIAGKGSAIFLHLAPDDFAPSAGCVTLSLENLLTVIREATKDSAVHILNP